MPDKDPVSGGCFYSAKHSGSKMQKNSPEKIKGQLYQTQRGAAENESGNAVKTASKNCVAANTGKTFQKHYRNHPGRIFVVVKKTVLC